MSDVVQCACGCGASIPRLDSRGRERRFIKGHNGRKYTDPLSFSDPLKAAKLRHQAKKHANAPMVECSCGCGRFVKSVDVHGIERSYINGHNGRKFEDPKQYRKNYAARTKDVKVRRCRRKYRERKVALVVSKGGTCAECGFEYNGKNAAVFHLHHDSPDEKRFTIASTMNSNWDDVLAEAEKCTLLCANCHSMHHSEEY